MKLKLLLIVSLLSLVGRIAFSIYFSIKIVDENALINRFQNQVSDLSIQNQSLENQLALLTSIDHLQQQINGLELTPINSVLDLR